MRQIYKIAKAELYTLFYSPIAWMILVIFAFQTAFVFSGVLQELTRYQELVDGVGAGTYGLFGSQVALFPAVQGYLYLYMPLLTMGLMSRELSSGSVKLLYSSPLTSSQIIAGKFLAMMLYSLLMIGILLVYVVFAGTRVENFSWQEASSGLLGLYMLMCAYSAIGLFMSCLTGYPVVAALGTLVLLALLNYIGKVWQSVEFVRDLTYWLSISGRSGTLIAGLIGSEDVLYFLIIMGLFLSLAVLRLQASRAHASFASVWSKYSLVLVIALALGYLTSRPVMKVYYDATETKRNTLTPNSQDVVRKMTGGLTITTYVNLLDREAFNGLPAQVNEDKDRFSHYLRFKPETKFRYVYYYDQSVNPAFRSPKEPKDQPLAEQAKKRAEVMDIDVDMFLTPEEIKKKIDLSAEGNTFVRVIERENGQKSFLRLYNDMMKFPNEGEITAAFKRMVMKLPRIGFLEGGRRLEGDRAKDYTLFSSERTFRYSLTNQGSDVETLDLSGDKQIPEDMDIIVIADLKEAPDSNVRKKIDAYIAAGGNLVVTLKPGSEVMEDFIAQFGLKTVPGQLVQPKLDVAGNVVICVPTKEGKAMAEIFDNMDKRGQWVGMVNSAGLEKAEDKGFKFTPIISSRDTMKTWNELQTIDFVNDSATLDPATGEHQGTFVTMMGLSRQVGKKEQRIVVLGDADCISNAGMTPPIRRYGASNFTLIPGMFHWLSYGTVPVDVSRPAPTDNQLHMKKNGAKAAKTILMWVWPGIILLAGAILLIRRRRK
ncbi:Gldg family protein [Chitinophaga sp. GCM10012297]|uniref:Gldg family protein n=1 Tax=Chitinophaga chungangae TaxID=2821488 RepID=A0ABS3YFZ7_9BACT|nr:Gldg family protein [Chitinophaga chungangae]MBO9153603.1 Gldg family protein [Chitinophaga chungangae]